MGSTNEREPGLRFTLTRCFLSQMFSLSPTLVPSQTLGLLGLAR